MRVIPAKFVVYSGLEAVAILERQTRHGLAETVPDLTEMLLFRPEMERFSRALEHSSREMEQSS